MPLDGKQLDELLSGFIDGELTDVELELVEKAARDDVRIAERIELLRRQSSWVQQFGQSQLEQLSQFSHQSQSNQQSQLTPDASQERSSSTLAQRVIAEARQRGRELGLPATHYVRSAERDVVHLPAPGADVSRGASKSGVDAKRATKSSSRRMEAWLALGGLAAAAAVLLAVTWPKLEQPNLPSTPSSQLAQHDNQPQLQHDQLLADKQDGAAVSEQLAPAESLASKGAPLASRTAPLGSGTTRALTLDEDNAAAGSNLVGMSDGLAYALVVDVEVSAQAERSRVLEKLLTSAGIPLAPPVAVNAQILKALDDSRLVVREPTSEVHAVSIQVVRGELQELDSALRRIWQDSDSFPNVGLNLSIDSRAALMREMLRSSGDRFAPTDRFAVPLAADQVALAPALGNGIQGDAPAGRASSLMADDAEVHYVSSSQRKNGWEGLGELSGITSKSLATILLVIHYAD